MSKNDSLGGRDAQAITEIDLAGLTGVDRQVLRKARATMPEGSVDVVPGSGVYWSKPAVESLCRDLGIPEIAEQIWPELRDQAARDDVVTVERIPRNPRLVFCRASDGRMVRVRVKRNDRFVPRMEVPVRYTGPDADVAVLTRKLPRRKGAW